MTVARLRYFVGPGAEVSSPSVGLISFDRDGFFETSDDAEIAVLDALADSVGHPVQHADPGTDKPAPKKPAPKTPPQKG